MVVVAGLTVPAIIATEAAAHLSSADLRRYVPLQPGSTSVFATRTNGKPSDLLFEQVVAPALDISQTPGTVAIVDHFANFEGLGRPLDIRSLDAVDDDRVVTFGSRAGADPYLGSTPPEVVLQLPLVRGSTWTWQGKRRGGTGRSVTTILSIADRTVLGRTFSDCLHLRVSSHDTDDQGNPSTDVQETWHCPDVGPVQTDEVFRRGTIDIHFESELVEAHHPGLNLRGPGAPPLPVALSGLDAGQTDGVDAGHSWYVPGARLSTDRLAWSLARKSDSLYSPVGSGRDVITAEDDGTICSTDIRTGQVNWQVTLSGPIVASPVVARGLVLVADSTKSLWALDAASGAAEWVIRLPDVVSTTPAIIGGLAVVATDDLSVRAIELTTGAQEWLDITSNLVAAPPVVADGLVVVGDQAGNLEALRPDDGTLAWTDSSIGVFSGGISVLGGLSAGSGTILASTDSATVFAFDAASGDLRWRAQAPSAVDRPAAITGDRAVIASDDSVEARDLATGRQFWRRRTDTTFAPPLVVGDTVAVLQTDNHLLTFSLADGAESTVLIGAIDDPSDQDTKLPMSWAAGALVVPTRNGGPWPFTVYQAFPAPRGDAGPVLGLRLSGDFYGLGGPPNGPGSIGDGGLVAPMIQFHGNTTSGRIVESRPGGPESRPTRTLHSSTAVPSSALVAGDRVISQVGSEVLGIPVHGGKPWAAPGSQGAAPPLIVPDAIPGGSVVVVPDTKAGLTGLDAATGRTLWGPVAKPAVAGFGSPVEVPDGSVAWGGGALTVVDPATGRVLHRNDAVTPFTSLAEDGGDLYGIVLAGGKFVLAGFGGTTLRPVWAHEFNPAAVLGVIPLAPAAGGGVVTAVDSTNVLRAFDRTTGKALWSLQLRLSPNSPPVAWQGRVYVEEPGLTEDLEQHEHRLTVLDARTGAFEAAWDIPGVSFSSGAFSVSADRLLVAFPSGVAAIRPEER